MRSEKEEIGHGEDRAGERGASALAARKPRERGVGRKRQAELRERFGDSGVERPVCLGQFVRGRGAGFGRSEEHTSELQSLMRHSYAVFCLKKQDKSHL